MSDTIDHKSGQPTEAGAVAVGAGAVGAAALVNLAFQNKEAIAAAGSAVAGVAAANPKITVTVVAAAAVGYGIYRLTQPGTKFEFGNLKYERK